LKRSTATLFLPFLAGFLTAALQHSSAFNRSTFFRSGSTAALLCPSPLGSLTAAPFPALHFHLFRRLTAHDLRLTIFLDFFFWVAIIPPNVAFPALLSSLISICSVAIGASKDFLSWNEIVDRRRMDAQKNPVPLKGGKEE
jgi:hypothetical protein